MDLEQLRGRLNAILHRGPMPHLDLVIEVAQSLSGVEPICIRDAVDYVLETDYISADSNGKLWRQPNSDSEASHARAQWEQTARTRRSRLLGQVTRGANLGPLNQFELAWWIEDAAAAGDAGAVDRLFPLLKRDWFTQERLFELDRSFDQSHRRQRELKDRIERQREKVQLLQQELRAAEDDLRALLRQQNASGEKEPISKPRAKPQARREKPPTPARGSRPVPKPGRFTGIVIRAGGQEGKMYSVLEALGLRKYEMNNTEGMKKLLRSGYQVEVIQGNEQTPSGTVFKNVKDL